MKRYDILEGETYESREGSWVLYDDVAHLLRKELHCATCQCAKVNAPKPVPDNPMSRSWHDNSAQEPKS